MKVLDMSYHPLDVRSGGWLDLSRKGNHGTPYGGARPYMIAPGVMGFKFDGSSGYVDCGDSASFDFNVADEFTIAAWIRRNRVFVVEIIAGKYNEKGYTFGFTSTSHNKFSLYLRGDTYYYYRKSLTDITPASGLIYLAGVYNNNDIKLYLNAVDNTGDATGNMPTSFSTNAKLNIGRTESGFYFSNLIIQPIIEDRAWSEAEVRENMYRSPIYCMLRGLPYSVYIKVPWKQQGGIYVP
ncbi:MAG TPA: LamG domain-containing protein [Candidatus Atribacteria bacterium]|nr:LamG domain-containing protein [Candidatus Atribacteria bacterium]